jgi:hypothetical protein
MHKHFYSYLAVWHQPPHSRIFRDTTPMKLLTTTLLLALAAPALHASVVYVQYSGIGTASGSIDDSPFSDEDWTLEFGLDTTAPDTHTGDPNVGFFDAAIVSGSLRLGSITYTLSAASAIGKADLWHIADFNTNRGAIGIRPSSGGSASFLVAAAAMVPSVFTDSSDLGSLIPGASISNITKDGRPQDGGNGSEIRFAYDSDPDYGYDERLITSTGSAIQLFAYSAPLSGTMTVTVSSTSVFAPASSVPEPASTLPIVSLLGSALLLRRHRTHSL